MVSSFQLSDAFQAFPFNNDFVFSVVSAFIWIFSKSPLFLTMNGGGGCEGVLICRTSIFMLGMFLKNIEMTQVELL